MIRFVPLRSTRLPLLLLSLSVLVGFTARAVPYASCITNDFAGGNVYYYLNEDSDNVKYVISGVTNDLGAQAKGLHSFPVPGATSYQLLVAKAAAATWVRSADDILSPNKYMRYFSPGGISPNRNAKNLSYFGRIYVVENVGGATASTGTARTDQEGIYILNADQSDALGMDDTALNGGLTFVSGSASASDGPRSPWKIEVGEDNFVYITDCSTNNGGVFRVDPNGNAGEIVLATPGRAANTSVHTDVTGSAITKGSLAGGNLQLWTIDGAWSPGGFNRLLRYDINGAALPYNSAPSAILRTAGVPTVADINSDLDIAPDGKFFVCQSRAAGTGTYAADRVNIRVLDTDGLTVLWDSLAQSTNILANASATDIFVDAYSIKVSPDGKKVAISRADTQTWIMGMTNGIPDISTRQLLNTFAGTSTSTSANRRREIAFDAAGNLYAGNNSLERMVIWSPGGTTTAVTSFDNTTGNGSFQVLVPDAVVSVTASPATTTEGGAPGKFTISRTGNTSTIVTVNYTNSGTATSGSDYTALSGTVTLLANAASTNIDVTALTDGTPEFTETVVLTLLPGSGYGISTTNTATVSILDVGTPEISIAGTQTNLLESFADCKGVFTLTRKGTISSPTTVNLSYSGTAVRGTDYNGPLSVTFLANAASTNITLTPINDPDVEPAEDYTITIQAGSYNIGAGAGSSGGMVYSEDLAAGTPLFSDKFDGDTSPNWTVSTLDPAENDAVFGFEYGVAMGIPEAPSSSGAFTPTRGLRIRSHLTAATVVSGISVSPNGGNFTGDYRLRFDLWMNYIGPLPLGGTGSTEHSSFGVGVSGANLVWPTGSDGIWFTAATDSDVGDTSVSQADYGIFAVSLQPTNSGYYAAGNGDTVRGNGNPYYSAFGGSSVPAQQAIFATQSGAVRQGALGMAWHAVTITVQGDNVTWDVDGYRMGTVPISATIGAFSGNNIFLGFHDWFSSACANPALEFALYDNVRVETLSAPVNITITSIQIIGNNVQIDFSAGASDTTASFELLSSTNAGGSYTVTGGTFSQLGSGSFRVVTPVSGNARFYKIHHL